MRSEVRRITPEIAKEILASNTGNRRIRSTVVSRYADEMAAGTWSLTHQGIAIDRHGNLLDGQHRLSAIVKSGIPCNMMVTSGLDAEVFSSIDRLTPRSDADALRMDRKVVDNFRMIAEMHYRKSKPSIDEVQSVVSVFLPTLNALNLTSTNAKVFSTVPVRVAAILAAAERPYNAKKISHVYHNMVLGSISDLPISAQSIVREVFNGSVHATRSSARVEVMRKFFTVFCFDNENLAVIRPANMDRIDSIITTAMRVKV